MPRLVVTNGPRAGAAFPFDAAVVVGRGSSAELTIEHPTVSRRHAQLAPGGGGWLVSDLGTPNGTWVNGQPISQPTLLKPGDQIKLGTIVVRYEEAGAEPAASGATPVVSFDERGAGGAAVVVRMEAAGVPLLPAEAARSQSLARRLEFLSDLAGDLGRTFDEAAQLDRILDRLFELLPQAERGFILLLEAGRDELIPRAARKRGGDAAGISVSRTLVREVIGSRRGILSVDVLGDSRWSGSQSMVGIGIRSAMCVPIVAEDEAFGAIQVDSTRAGQPFDEGDMALMLGVARQLALSLSNARLHARLVDQELLHHDLMLAGRLQQRFLPRGLPEIPGYSFAVEYSPALEVGGDFYAFLELAEGRVGIAVGDVSGKGVSAALCMAKLTSELRYHSVGQSEPKQILERVNRSLVEELEEGMFVTVALMSLDPGTGELKVSLAGHPSPLARDAKGQLVELGHTGGSALGVSARAVFDERSYTLDRSDVVVVFTDGITEALNKKKTLFGEDRLCAAVRRAAAGPAAVRDAVIADVDAFVEGCAQSDDLTLVCFGHDPG